MYLAVNNFLNVSDLSNEVAAELKLGIEKRPSNLYQLVVTTK